LLTLIVYFTLLVVSSASASASAPAPSRPSVSSSTMASSAFTSPSLLSVEIDRLLENYLALLTVYTNLRDELQITQASVRPSAPPFYFASIFPLQPPQPFAYISLPFCAPLLTPTDIPAHSPRQFHRREGPSLWQRLVRFSNADFADMLHYLCNPNLFRLVSTYCADGDK
jgi:hypothetical protein